MDISELLITSLGLQDVIIEKASYDKKHLKAMFEVRQVRDEAMCHKCMQPLHGVKQWRKRELKGPPLGAFREVQIIFYQLQGACGNCVKHRLSFAPFIHPQFKKYTTAFAELAGRLMEEMTCEAVARFTRSGSKMLWSLDQWRMNKMKEGFDLSDWNLDLQKLSADEVHMRTVKPKKRKFDKKAHKRKFITNLVSHNHSKILANARGRDAGSLKRCLKQLSGEQREGVKYLAVDMHDGYIRAAEEMCPNAVIAVDRFHLVQQMNERFNEVRQEELSKARKNKDLFQMTQLAGSRRFIFMEKERELSKKDQKTLDRLRQLNQNINTAMLLVEFFHRILDKTKLRDFRKAMKTWYGLVKASGLKPLQGFAKLVRKYRLRIEAYIRSRLTTAISEGLNNKIKVLKRMGYGYTNDESFMNKILQRCGLLNSTYIDTTQWFWHVT